MMFVPILRPQFSVVDEFSKSTERGAAGFGSTGRGT
jgi:dUTP pyrophosphatase